MLLLGFVSASSMALSPCLSDRPCADPPLDYLAVVYLVTQVQSEACAKLDPQNAPIYAAYFARFQEEDPRLTQKARTHPDLENLREKIEQSTEKMPLENLQRECRAMLKNEGLRPR